MGTVGALSFGATAVGSSTAAQTVTVANTGNSDLDFTHVGFSGGNTSDFTMDVNTTSCNFTVPLASGRSCKIGFIFKPTATGTRSTVLSITDDTIAGVNTIQLTGTGATTATLTPSSLSFASTSVGSTSSSQTVTLANTGTAVLTISSIAFSGAAGCLHGHDDVRNYSGRRGKLHDCDQLQADGGGSTDGDANGDRYCDNEPADGVSDRDRGCVGGEGFYLSDFAELSFYRGGSDERGTGDYALEHRWRSAWRDVHQGGGNQLAGLYADQYLRNFGCGGWELQDHGNVQADGHGNTDGIRGDRRLHRQPDGYALRYGGGGGEEACAEPECNQLREPGGVDSERCANDDVDQLDKGRR